MSDDDAVRERLERIARNTPVRSAADIAEQGAADDADDEEAFWTADGWGRADPGRREWPAVLTEYDQFMCTPSGEKYAFAPWGDRDHPDAACTDADHDAETCDGCDCDARYKWANPDMWGSFDTAREWSKKDPALDDALMFIVQREGDPYRAPSDPVLLIDGDDVIDDEGRAHPGFIAVLNSLVPGGGYAALSSSNHGAHIPLRGRLPDGTTQLKIPLERDVDGFSTAHLDDDERPHIDIFDGKHLAKETGKRVAGTPTDAGTVDEAALAEYAEDYGPSLPSERARDGGAGAGGSAGVAEPHGGEYAGPDPDEWDIPDDRNLEYHAGVEAHYHGHAHVNHWRVVSVVASHGQRLGKTPDEIIDDLRDDDTRPGTSDGWGGATVDRVTYDYRRTEGGAFAPPGRATLARWGILPDEYADDAGGATDAPTPPPGVALGDGGTAAAGGATDDDGPPPADTDEWRYVREVLSSDDGNGPAHTAAAQLLRDEFDPITVMETGEIHAYDADAGIFRPDGDARIRTFLAETLGDEYSRRRVGEIIHRLESETFKPRDTLGGPEGVLCLENGVLDLAPLRARPDMDPADLVLDGHSPVHRMTAAHPVAFDPGAAEADVLDEWLAFLRESVAGGPHGGEKAVRRLQEHAGYLLHVGGFPFKKVLGIFGPNDSGKTTFLNIVQALIGDANTQSEPPTKLANNRFSAANLDGAAANIVSEIGTKTADDVEHFKQVTGNERTMRAETKGEQAYQFSPTAKHLYAANQVPDINGADAAFYERWTFVEFPNVVPREERDPELVDRFTTDEARRALLMWALEGYRRLFDPDTAGGRGVFTGERTLDEKRAIWTAHGDPLARFITDCLDTSAPPASAAVPTADAYEAYKQFVDVEADEGAEAESQYQFTMTVKREGGVGNGQRRAQSFINDGERSRCLVGVRLTGRGEEMLSRALGGAVSPADIRAAFPGADD